MEENHKKLNKTRDRSKEILGLFFGIFEIFSKAKLVDKSGEIRGNGRL